MFRVCEMTAAYVILLAARAAVQLCNASTTESTTSETTSNDITTANTMFYDSTMPWIYPKMPLRLTIVILEPRNISSPFALAKVLPAVELATEHVNHLYNGIFRLNIVHDEGSCERNVVGISAARVSCKHNITAFIGPACSKAVETIAYMANDWNLPVITPVANTENVGDKKVFPRLTRINSVMQSSFVSTVFYLMKIYKWRHAVFFYDNDVQVGDLLGETFTKAFKETNYIWNSYELSGNTQDQSSFRRPLMDAATRARVFILFMETKVLRSVLLEAYSLGYSTSKDFVFLILQSMSVGPTDATTWKLGNQSDQAVQDSLAQALFMHIDDSSVILPANFSREVRERAKRDHNFDFGTSQEPYNF